MTQLVYFLEKNNTPSREIWSLSAPVSKDIIDGLGSSELIHRVIVDSEGEVVKVYMKEKTLSTLPIFICPAILHRLKYMSAHNVLRVMFGTLVNLFPESVRHIRGLHYEEIGDSGDLSNGRSNRDLYLDRIVRSWMSKRNEAQLSTYIWSQWLKVPRRSSIFLSRLVRAFSLPTGKL